MSRCKYYESKNQVLAKNNENLVLLTYQLPLTNYQLAPHALLMVTNTIGLRFVSS